MDVVVPYAIVSSSLVDAPKSFLGDNPQKGACAGISFSGEEGGVPRILRITEHFYER